MSADRSRASRRTSAARVVGLVLAAGRSARMGGAHNKLVEAIGGRPLVAWPVDALEGAGVDAVVVVTGFEAERVEAALAGRACRFARHADWAEGMGSSLAFGVRAIAEAEEAVEAVLVCVGDLPGLRAAHVASVLAAARDPSGRIAPERIALPVFAGRTGHPVLFGAGWLARLAALEGDEGARALVREQAGRVVRVEQPDGAAAGDVDTPAALEAARRGAWQEEGGAG
ncbi:MAG: nucleotidyltransferase family protein [Myxococcota bacterium]